MAHNMEWTMRVMEIRKNPDCATPEDIIKLGGNPEGLDAAKIADLTDNFFLGLANASEPQVLARVSNIISSTKTD
jgi:hypothetical protein